MVRQISDTWLAPRPEYRAEATYEDLRAVPAHLIAELVDGELWTSPRPATPHARVASLLGSELMHFFDRQPGGPHGPGGWWVLHEPELHLDRDVLVPDLAAWRRTRMPRIQAAPFLDVAPDWLCEVLSPSTQYLDRTRKLAVYARAGVAHVWLVDPLQRLLEVLRLTGEHYLIVTTIGGDDLAQVEPFEAAAFEMARWWLDPPEPEPGAAAP